jgi:hypothetical protein
MESREHEAVRLPAALACVEQGWQKVELVGESRLPLRE